MNGMSASNFKGILFVAIHSTKSRPQTIKRKPSCWLYGFLEMKVLGLARRRYVGQEQERYGTERMLRTDRLLLIPYIIVLLLIPKL